MSIYQIVTKARDASNNQFRNIHHYEFAGYVPTDTQLQEFVDNFDAAHKARLQSVTNENITYYAYDVRQVDVGDLPSREFIPTLGAWDGSNSAAVLPYQVAAIITWKAYSTFPRSTRMYVFGLTENASAAGGVLEAGMVTVLQNLGDDLLTIDITGGLDPDKQAVEYGGDPRVVVDANDVETVMVSPFWGTQRKRRPGTGI